MSLELTTWVVVRRHLDYQTGETLVMCIMRAFVGTDSAEVERAAHEYRDEQAALGEDPWLEGLPGYRRRNTVVLFEVEPAETTEETRS